MFTTDFVAMLEQETGCSGHRHSGGDPRAARVDGRGRGVHVMLQKPMTPTLAEADALIRGVGDSVRFMVHENYRFRPHYVQMRAVARGGPRRRHPARPHARAQREHDIPGRKYASAAQTSALSVQQFRRLIVFEVLIHQLTSLRLFCGPLRVVSCQLSKVNPDLAGEDVAVIVMRGRGGRTVVLDGNISGRRLSPRCRWTS